MLGEVSGWAPAGLHSPRGLETAAGAARAMRTNEDAWPGRQACNQAAVRRWLRERCRLQAGRRPLPWARPSVRGP